MFIVSPKWIYLDNKKLESKKSVLIDGSLIIDVLTDSQIEKRYKNLPRTTFSNHIMMPTLTECYLNIDECDNQHKYNEKMNNILSKGITNVQIVTKKYKDILNYEPIDNLKISYIITLDSSECSNQDLKEMINTIDYYKSDQTKIFSINLINVISFDSELIEKISSICNELNLNIIIHLKELITLTDSHVDKVFKFWENINLLNNCSVHDFLSIKREWRDYFNKKNINLLIRFRDLNNKNNLDLFLTSINTNYKCILVSDEENVYRFFDFVKIVYTLGPDDDKFDTYKITNCVTTNASSFFIEISNSSKIRKGNLASFNLFKYNSNKFLAEDSNKPSMCDLDNSSLTNVWSSGIRIDTDYE